MAETFDWQKAVRNLRAEGLSARAAHCLANLDCYKLEDAQRFTRDELLRGPNLGRKTVNKITEALQERGLSLADPPPPTREQAIASAMGRVNATRAAYEAAQKRLDMLLANAS